MLRLNMGNGPVLLDLLKSPKPEQTLRKPMMGDKDDLMYTLTLMT
jgi:hypothetical protein